MFRVEVATIAKPKTLIGRVRGPRKESSSPAIPRILPFPPTAGEALRPPSPRPHLLCDPPTFHNHKPRLSLGPRSRAQAPPIFPESDPKCKAKPSNSTHTLPPTLRPHPIPVGCEFLANKSSRNLGDNVAPEKGAVYEANSLWIPGELSLLWAKSHIKPASLPQVLLLHQSAPTDSPSSNQQQGSPLACQSDLVPPTPTLLLHVAGTALP